GLRELLLGTVLGDARLRGLRQLRGIVRDERGEVTIDDFGETRAVACLLGVGRGREERADQHNAGDGSDSESCHVPAPHFSLCAIPRMAGRRLAGPSTIGQPCEVDSAGVYKNITRKGRPSMHALHRVAPAAALALLIASA